jgi:signal transduction histidine kinase
MTHHAADKDPNEIAMHLSNQIDAMLAYWDKDLICRFANNAYGHWFGKSKTEIVNTITLPQLLGPLFEENLPQIRAVLDGQVQIFERDIPSPTGGTRHSLATYTPDIADGIVKGFFVHVADVSYLKKSKQTEAVSKKEIIKTAIETQEKERERIAHYLRDNVNQTLVYCNMVLQIKKYNEEDTLFHNDVSNQIQNAIAELNLLSTNLSPSGTEFLGLIKGAENYIYLYKKRFKINTNFTCTNQQIENLAISDKLSLFRIIQDYLLQVSHSKHTQQIDILLKYDGLNLQMQLQQNNPAYTISRESNEFKDIALRVEYFGGNLQELPSETGTTLLIDLPLPYEIL